MGNIFWKFSQLGEGETVSVGSGAHGRPQALQGNTDDPSNEQRRHRDDDLAGYDGSAESLTQGLQAFSWESNGLKQQLYRKMGMIEGDSLEDESHRNLVLREFGDRLVDVAQLPNRDDLDLDQWKHVVYGAASFDPKNAFLMFVEQDTGLDVEVRKTACRRWLQMDPMAASDYIMSMEGGESKALAVGTVVEYLRATGESEDLIRAWMAEHNFLGGE